MNIQLFAMSKAYFAKQYSNVDNSTAKQYGNAENSTAKQYGNVENSTAIQYNNQYHQNDTIVNPSNNTETIRNHKNFDTVELSNVSQKEDSPTVEKCQTCENRKYQDGSNDPSVSFKTPTAISPDRAAAAVRNHEMEHVFNEQAKALKEDREVVSQSVTYKTNVCPDCHRVYVSGGETRTVTRNKTENTIQQPEKGKFFDAVA